MVSEFKVSVIIPVYNAARYVAQAVESALLQPETQEVMLVEDHSPDTSLDVCRELAQQYPQVHLLQHPGGVNRGAGPSRNLGIEKSNAPFIAFLDADDFYLPCRFARVRETFETDPTCDGAYEAVGIHFEEVAAQQRWLSSDMAQVRLTTLQNQVPADDLFRVLIKGGKGHIHLNGLVVKRTILEKSGVMNDDIADTLHEDTDFILRLAAVGRLLPGEIQQPSSMRRVHNENRVSAPRPEKDVYRDHMRQRVATYRWLKRHGSREQRLLAFKRMLVELRQGQTSGIRKFEKLAPSCRKTMQLLGWIFSYPEVMSQKIFWYELGSSMWGILRNDILHLKDTK